MNEEIWQEIADAYRLGTGNGLPQAVTGGLKHRLYHARTHRAEYAVKVLSAPALREHGSLERYQQAERIAQHAAGAGLPAVLALPGPDGPLHKVGTATDSPTVMVFPWLSGIILPPAPASPATARQVGALLGRLHSLSPDVGKLEPLALPRYGTAHWTQLACQGEKEGIPWAGVIREALPELGTWSAAAWNARVALGDDWRATHRDMDQKNVLWTEPETPWLLDWEEAGAMHPSLEVMGTALNWAGQSVGSPAEAPFLAFLDGYRSTLVLDQPVTNRLALTREKMQHAAVAVLGKWLLWLDFNLRRSLAASGAGQEERAGAVGSAEHALATLQVLSADTDRRLQWCDRL